MATFNIHRGLRRMVFENSPRAADGARPTASVDFARDEPLPAGVSVRVPLGLRDGKMRALIGVPLLLDNDRPGSKEYLYRLSGSISEFQPDPE